MLTWRAVYQDEVERQADTLRTARDRGQTWLVLDGRTRDPSRMSNTAIYRYARLEAERITNYAINVENEQARKAGRPADNY